MKKTDRVSMDHYRDLIRAAERAFDKRAVRVELEMGTEGMVVIVSTSSDTTDESIGEMVATMLQGWLVARCPKSPEQWEAMRAAPREFLRNLPEDVRDAVVAAAREVER